MPNYITMSNLTLTEGLGSQMYHFACLFAISKHTKHKICFFNENINIGKGLLLNKYFSQVPIDLISISELSDQEKIYYSFPITRDVVIDSRVFVLNPSFNYDFKGLFNTYKMWYPFLQEIKEIYSFSEEVLIKASSLVEQYRTNDREVVSVHVRRGDYLLPSASFFTHLSKDYFDYSMSKFDINKTNFLFFSDGIDWCKENFGDKDNIFFSNNTSDIIDLAAMTLCDHNIISNSGFGLWGAVLNKNNNRRVICPSKYLKNDYAVPHFNHSWFPDDFEGVLIGNN